MKPTVVVAGAGPVGTCFAIDAAMRGLSVVVLEPRRADQPPDAKCNTIASRTMETFRRFGVADKVRAAGLPDDYPTDTVYTSTLAGPEYTRIRMPSRSERAKTGFYDSEWLTPEGMVRQSQLFLEPILRERLLSEANIDFRAEHEFVSYRQDKDTMEVTIRNVASGEEFVINTSYLVGCDGGSSAVRKQMGVKLAGDAELGRTRTSLIRSNEVKALFGDRRPAWMNWIANHKVTGNVIAINGEDLWLVHRSIPGGGDFEEIDLDQSIRDALGVGKDFQYEVVHHQDWIGRRLVAERFRDDRVFIAGDAAHLWVPYAGYGMNAGIADAMNLSWLISAVVNGWGNPAILDAYEAERLPITDQVSRLAMGKMAENARVMSTRKIPASLSWRGPIGGFMRSKLGQRLFDMNLPQMVPAGLNYGYYYEDSPIISYDGEKPPQYDMGEYTPSTVPGCRLPHFWIENTSVLDLLGDDYTLLKFSEESASELEQAASHEGLPLTVCEVPAETEHPHISDSLLIVRSDQTIAWRGDQLPDDVMGLIRQLRGAA